MSKKINVTIIVVIGLLAVFIALYFLNNKSVPSGKYDSFATCITNSGATMYGTEWCPHCKDQKAMFGDALKNIVFVDCDASGDACKNAGVTSYPTWIFGDGTSITGTQSLAVLASRTGCTLPN